MQSGPEGRGGQPGGRALRIRRRRVFQVGGAGSRIWSDWSRATEEAARSSQGGATVRRVGGIRELEAGGTHGQE